MKKLQGYFMAAGFLIYFVITLVDRFLLKIPDFVYIPLLLIASACLVAALIISRRQKTKAHLK